MRAWLLAGAGAVALAVLVWFGIGYVRSGPPPASRPVPTVGDTALDAPPPPADVVTIETPNAPLGVAGATPMAQRVAVIGVLNKRNGVARDVTMKPGEAVRLGDIVLRLRACEQTAPWEPEHLTGAFVQFDVEQPDKSWRRFFSGWLFKERPALNIVQHPIYDVWTKSCAMTFPSGGDDAVVVTDPSARSSAKKSAAPDADNAASPDATPPTGAPPSTAPATTPAIAPDNKPI